MMKRMNRPITRIFKGMGCGGVGVVFSSNIVLFQDINSGIVVVFEEYTPKPFYMYMYMYVWVKQNLYIYII